MAGDYAIKSIVLIDFIDVKDIAIKLPFLEPTEKNLLSLIFQWVCGITEHRAQTAKAHFVAVLEGNSAARKGWKSKSSLAIWNPGAALAA